MMVRGVILVLAFLAAAAPARADCADDITTLQARIATMPKKSPNLGPANKQLQKAIEQQPQDEVACDNAVARAWHAINKPLPVANENAQQQ